MCAKLPNAIYRVLNVVGHSICISCQTLASPLVQCMQRGWQSSAHRPSLLQRSSSCHTCFCQAPWCIHCRHSPSAANSPIQTCPACLQVNSTPRHLQNWLQPSCIMAGFIYPLSDCDLLIACRDAAGVQQQQWAGDEGQRQHPIRPAGVPSQGVGPAQLA